MGQIIKKFLRINWKKTFLTVIIFILLVFYGGSLFDYPLKTVEWYGGFVPITEEYGGIYYDGTITKILPLIFNIFIHIIISYLISCLIIWIFNRLNVFTS